MSLPEDVLLEREHTLAKLTARDARILARIRRAIRSLTHVRKLLAKDRAAHGKAVETLAARKVSP